MSDLLLIQVSDECFVCKQFKESNLISVTYSVADDDSSIASFIGKISLTYIIEEALKVSQF